MKKRAKKTKPMIDQPAANLIGFVIVILIVIGILGIVAKYDRHQREESTPVPTSCQVGEEKLLTPAPVGELL